MQLSAISSHLPAQQLALVKEIWAGTKQHPRGNLATPGSLSEISVFCFLWLLLLYMCWEEVGGRIPVYSFLPLILLRRA